MKTDIRHSLGDATVLPESTLAPGVTAAAYLELMRDVSNNGTARGRYRDHAALNVFERWLLRTHRADTPFEMDEDTLEQIGADMASGSLRRADRRKYGSMARSVPTVIRAIHNRAAHADSRVLRSLLNRRVYGRLRRFSTLTAATQDLLLRVERTGQRRSRKSGRHTRPMTGASRKLAIDSTLTLLDRLNASGVEQVTRDNVTALVGNCGDTDAYRTTVRLLHCAAPVFRIGHEQGLLAKNVLDDIDNDTFKEQARRDFLPPEEVAKLRDLSSVDTSDRDRVRDRLVALLLYDLAVRKSELAGLTLDDIEPENGHYDVRLRPEVQKGTKPIKRLRVLFPETTKLLRIYLQDVRASFPGKALIVDMKGRPASGAAIEGAVRREATRLDLRCYRSNRLPTPHAFRRSFATINSQPLGLGMSVHELADRLRDSVRVVDESYRLHNPLIESMRADHYQQKLNDESPPQVAGKAIDVLEAAGAPKRLLRSLRHWLEAQVAPVMVPGPAVTPDEAWVSEDEMLAVLAEYWTTVPRARALRDYFRSSGALRRGGSKGRRLYRETAVRDLAGGYVPVADHVTSEELRSRPVRDFLSQCDLLDFGAVKLIEIADLPAVSRVLVAYRASIPSRTKTGKTEARNAGQTGVLQDVGHHNICHRSTVST